MRSGIALATLLMASMSCAAADADNKYAVWGEGQTSCHSYNQARAADDIGHFKPFITGYITAYNAFVPDTYNVTGNAGIDEVIGRLDGYCQEKQTDGFEAALHHVIDDMKDQRTKKNPARAGRWP